MNFTRANNGEGSGTSLQGFVLTTRQHLETEFGIPSEYTIPFESDKVTTEWVIKFDDGNVATLYDWKLPRQPSFYQMYNWHIGGTSPLAVDLVYRAIGMSVTNDSYMNGRVNA